MLRSERWRFERGALRCEECHGEARSEEARQWRAYVTVVEERAPAEVVVYCPDCARREFGEDDDLNGRIPTIDLGRVRGPAADRTRGAREGQRTTAKKKAAARDC